MSDFTDFHDVDGTRAAAAHIGYLDMASATEGSSALKRRSIDLLELRPGDHVLEVGCGNGDEARAMVARTVPGGHVTAVDVSGTMLDEARRRGTEGVTFVQMDGHDLRFPNENFDACRVERTLQHCDDPARVLREMTRVLRKGRRLVAGEPDWETLLVSASDVGVTRRIVDHQVELPRHRHGRIGRRLAVLLVDAGLRVVAVEGVVLTWTDFALADRLLTLTGCAESAASAGVITPEESSRWLAELDDQSRRGALVASVCGYMALGEKPL